MLEFNECPYQDSVPFPLKFSNEESIAIDAEIKTFLSKNILTKAEHCSGEYISNIFTRKKSDGSLRMILNLSGLNKFVTYHHFKMDTIEKAIKLVTKNCYMGSVDLKDAYFSVPIHPKYRKFFRFIWKGQLYEFTCYPQGWSSAPRMFTKICKPVYSTLRSMGYVNMGYIDDSFLKGHNYVTCKNNICDTINLMSELGFIVHPKKSVIIPTQIICFLGFILNSILMRVTLPEDKIITIVKECKTLSLKSKCTIRQLARVVGLLVSSFPAVEFGKLHYRILENHKIMALKHNQGEFNALMPITKDMKSELQWWIDNLHAQYREISRPNPSLILSADASDAGFGITNMSTGQTSNGRWFQNENQTHINYRELLAAFFAIKSFCQNERNVVVKIFLDNTTAIAYINNMGGCKSIDCNRLAVDIWNWCLERQIYVIAAFLPGKYNIEADYFSRHFNDQLEWQMNKKIFKKLCNIWGTPDIDLFASRINAQLTNYVAWKPDPEALFIDAFTFSWQRKFMYIFPPFSLIGDVVKKIFEDQAKALLIVPIWTTQPWFTPLLQMMIDYPIMLPKSNLLRLPHLPQITHPMPKLQMMAIMLSGNPLHSKEFLRELPPLTCQVGEQAQNVNITPIY